MHIDTYHMTHMDHMDHMDHMTHMTHMTHMDHMDHMDHMTHMDHMDHRFYMNQWGWHPPRAVPLMRVGGLGQGRQAGQRHDMAAT